jgi:hypothetical protein
MVVDRNTNGFWGNGSVTHREDQKDKELWGFVNIQDRFAIYKIKVLHCCNCCTNKSYNFESAISNGGVASWTYVYPGVNEFITDVEVPNVVGDKIQIPVSGTQRVLSLADVQVHSILP